MTPALLLTLALAAPPEVKRVTYDQLDAAIKSHVGKVVVVDVWSLGCPTCLKKFPDVVKLHADLKDRGLVVLTVNTDDPDDDKEKAKVVKFLTDKGATFTTLMHKDDAAAEKKWDATYPLSFQPAMWIYDRGGVRVDDLAAKLKPDELRAKVETLLDKK